MNVLVLHMVSNNHLGNVVGKVREDLTIYIINRGAFHILFSSRKEFDYKPIPSIFN